MSLAGRLAYSSRIESRAVLILFTSSAVRMPAAAMALACALLAATSWGSSCQSNARDRCQCSNSWSRGSRKRPDHIFDIPKSSNQSRQGRLKIAQDGVLGYGSGAIWVVPEGRLKTTQDASPGPCPTSAQDFIL